MRMCDACVEERLSSISTTMSSSDTESEPELITDTLDVPFTFSVGPASQDDPPKSVNWATNTLATLDLATLREAGSFSFEEQLHHKFMGRMTRRTISFTNAPAP